MAEHTNADGVTSDEIDAAYKVLETVRESFADDDMRNFRAIVNETHYLLQQYDEGSNWYPKYETPDVGDVVKDTEHIRKFGNGMVEVTGIPGETIEEHTIDCEYKSGTIAQFNPDHPKDAPVVLAKYVDGSDKVYAFPSTRLE